MDNKLHFSIVIPIYDRPDEIDELLKSLLDQTYKNFDLIIVEDGSTNDCRSVIEKYSDQLDIKYFYKENTGPGNSRNFGMEKAKGDYIILFDSDCLIPSHYFKTVTDHLSFKPLDAFGGADSAHDSFSNIQKAINFAMTAFITTGGIRGKEKNLDNYQPRSFNMGIHKKVYNKVGGFSDLHPGEDPDLSYRIMNTGCKVGFIPDAFVYHKRRINFKNFTKQVYKFGLTRTILMKWYPDKFKIVYLFPSIFFIGTLFLILLSFKSILFLAPILLFVLIVFFESLFRNKSLVVALLSVPASFIQLISYSIGFIRGFVNIHILKKEERKTFPSFFFNK